MSVLVYLQKMPYSKTAVEYGGYIAGLTKTGVTLLLVREKQNGESETEKTFEEAEALLAGVSRERKIRFGSDTKGILDEVRKGNYEMIVLRARKAIRYRQRLRKKIARMIAVESPISVLIVKDAEQPPELKRILVCSGGKDIANPVIRKGAELAQASGAELTLLHITTPVPSMYTGMDEIEETFEELLQTDTPTARHLRAAAGILAEYNLKSQLEVRQGDVTEEILEKSFSEHFDLVLVGAPQIKSRLKEWIMGDVTRNLVNHSESAVLIVR